jgi:hypothetical protein
MAQAELVSIAGRARITGAPANASTTPLVGDPVRAAHADFLAAVASHPPRPLPIKADPIDLQDRADHLNAVLGGLAACLAVILVDTVQNVPGSLDLCDAEGILTDLASDLTGPMLVAADRLAGGFL